MNENDVILFLPRETSRWLIAHLGTVPNHNLKYHAKAIAAVLRRAVDQGANSVTLDFTQARELGFFLDDCLRDLVEKARDGNKMVPRPLDPATPWPPELKADLDQAQAVLTVLGCQSKVFMDSHHGNWNHEFEQRP